MVRRLVAAWWVVVIALYGVALADELDQFVRNEDHSPLPTWVSGLVSGVWTVSDSPYWVTGDLTVPEDQTLTIEPGVEVKFAGHYKLTVNGTLLAIGAEQDSIVFTRAHETDASKWFGIRFMNADSTSLLAYCLIEWGKADGEGLESTGGGIMTMNASPTIEHCTIRYCTASGGGGGIYVNTGMPVIRDCLIHDCSTLVHGGGINSWHCIPIIERCIIYNCAAEGSGGGISFGGSSIVIRECTVVSNTGDGIYTGDDTNGSLNLTSCLIAYNAGVGIRFSSTSTIVRVRYNDIFENADGSFAGLTSAPAGLGVVNRRNANNDPSDIYNNIYLNPHFVDAAAHDYHLDCRSACIDGGDPALPRDPGNSLADIGALSATTGLALLTPNGGEIWSDSPLHLVRWNACNNRGTITIELNRNYPTGSWELLSAAVANDRDEILLIAEPSSDHCRIRICHDGSGVCDISDQDFLIGDIIEDVDMGDLDRCSYPTLALNPGHGLTGVAWLGNTISAEAEPHDIGEDDGDDGVTYEHFPWRPCLPHSVQVTVTAGPNYAEFVASGGQLYLNGWMDGNLNDIFSDTGCEWQVSEWIVQDLPVTPGVHPLTVMDPGRTDLYDYPAIFRWRLTSQPVGLYGYGLHDFPCMWHSGTYGFDPVGEVEDYVIADGQLAVELLSFIAVADRDLIRLMWETASETENDRFEIERDGQLIAVIPTAGNGADGHVYRWEDREITTGQGYRYALVAVDLNGVREEIAAQEVTAAGEAVITEYALHQNSPNPFNAMTTIRFDLAQADRGTLVLYNVMGQAVRTLASGPLAAGRHEIRLNASELPSGVYIYTLRTENFNASKKLLLVK